MSVISDLTQMIRILDQISIQLYFNYINLNSFMETNYYYPEEVWISPFPFYKANISVNSHMPFRQEEVFQKLKAKILENEMGVE